MDSLVGLLVWCAVLVTSDGALQGGTDDPVGISFLDCAGSSVLARAPTSQEEISIYTSIPEVRLGFPQRYLDMINDTYGGDHFEFMSEQQFILDNRPLYGDKLVIGDQRDYALQFLVDDGDVPTRCGGCFYQALVQNSSYRHGCPADIIIDVPTDCVRTSFHVDWIEPSDVTEESVFVTRSDIAREGPAPGDAFNPGVHTISYRPTERNSDFENCTFSVTLNANCPSDNVRTIIGPMQFGSTRVSSFSNSTLRFCPMSFGNMTLSTANVSRAVASCIYNADLGPVWREPADLTDCLKGVTDRFTLILQVLNNITVRLEQKLFVSHNEIVEVGLAIDSFSRLNDDNVDDPDFINQNAQLLRELIRLNITSVEVCKGCIFINIVDISERGAEGVFGRGRGVHNITEKYPEKMFAFCIEQITVFECFSSKLTKTEHLIYIYLTFSKQ
ncbi:uncharacterized protein [Apostichopus japonicus]|uniref:uncharacterized protein n=1 Tax=Stichopus japonicus TaxID=307972 RepID=UPI003AB5C55A